MAGQHEKASSYCSTFTADCINSRRCFMTGEYCSKQINIQKERARLHADNKINAFVIMNFSNMSDVVYKWRLKTFIESLKKLLYFSGDKIYCMPESTQECPEELKVCNQGGQDSHNHSKTSSQWEPVKEINVVRADSNYASNYVICNRVCQQMQIADLIIVDVSSENTNVFYEFGMAVAFQKMILPICYSESFFEMKVPDAIVQGEKKWQKALEMLGADEREEKEKKKEEIPSILDKISRFKRHIDCYPWRRTLFENYGIRYRSEKDSNCITEIEQEQRLDEKQGKDRERALDEIKSKVSELQVTQYLDYEEARRTSYGFTDIQYSRFPYIEKLKEDGPCIGELIYNRLKNTYNNARYKDNTLVVYTMDGFLNESQAGLCIINFFKNITVQMKEEHCFCGDRVGVLVQANTIPENVKDAKTEKNLLYGVGEIIHIGMNQALYTAAKEKIKPKDFLKIKNDFLENESGEAKNNYWKSDVIQFVKNHIRNKSILIYPNTPVYVNRVKNGLQKDIFNVENGGEYSLRHCFCLYHVMLQTLKYTNELVVDISKNSLQSLFWLGAAHGSDIYSITVQHEESEQERTILTGSPEKKERSIFDVSGLWAAILRSHDTEGFYHQLELAQRGIEQHSKLMPKDTEHYEERLKEYLYKDNQKFLEMDIEKIDVVKEITALFHEKNQREEKAMESYYRDRFWKPMLRYNQLQIYLPQVDDVNAQDNEPRLHTVKWDVDAIAALSHYLSKRKLIGEYSFKTLKKGVADFKAKKANFITVGSDAQPLTASMDSSAEKTESLAEYIYHQIKNGSGDVKSGKELIHKKHEINKQFACPGKSPNCRIFKGFACIDDHSRILLTQTPQSTCFGCLEKTRQFFPRKSAASFYHDENEIPENECTLKNTENVHIQLAQLVLWREVPQNRQDKVLFQVALTGASGPSTFALSALLVDDGQKEETFKLPNEFHYISSSENENTQSILNTRIGANLLSRLQEHIREKFMDTYFEELKKELNKPDKHSTSDVEKQFITQMRYAAAMYLSTVLYQYFLPFLSMEDECRLYNGMCFFISSMIAVGIPIIPTEESHKKNYKVFCRNVADVVSNVLKDILHKFRGVEALYQVEVLVDGETNCDSRKVLSIKELEGSYHSSVNCLFVR